VLEEKYNVIEELKGSSAGWMPVDFTVHDRECSTGDRPQDPFGVDGEVPGKEAGRDSRMRHLGQIRIGLDRRGDL
jgi:hypothetical protein